MKHAGRYLFVTDCVHSTYEDMQALFETEEDVSLATFRAAIGLEQWKEIQSQLGYGRDFPISKDWGVSYHKGMYKGVPAYYLRWSRIEYIYTFNGKTL